MNNTVSDCSSGPVPIRGRGAASELPRSRDPGASSIPGPLASLGSGRGVIIALAGDSTVTTKSSDKDQAGWGWALEQYALPNVYVKNFAEGGRSSRSFRDEGHWGKVMAAKPDWVMIQFGHNDQVGKGKERESDAETDYRKHLREYVQDAREMGSHPILVTPICRRIYNADGSLLDSLEPYAEAVRIVSQEMGVPYIDLHCHSFKIFSKLTPAENLGFSPDQNIDDRTHFSTRGSMVIASWVIELLECKVPEMGSFFQRKEGACKA